MKKCRKHWRIGGMYEYKIGGIEEWNIGEKRIRVQYGEDKNFKKEFV